MSAWCPKRPLANRGPGALGPDYIRQIETKIRPYCDVLLTSEVEAMGNAVDPHLLIELKKAKSSSDFERLVERESSKPNQDSLALLLQIAQAAFGTVRARAVSLLRYRSVRSAQLAAKLREIPAKIEEFSHVLKHADEIKSKGQWTERHEVHFKYSELINEFDIATILDTGGEVDEKGNIVAMPSAANFELDSAIREAIISFLRDDPANFMASVSEDELEMLELIGITLDELSKEN